MTVNNVEFFGVRHLSPGAAFEIRKRLDEVKPDLILLEGSCDLNEYQKWICHEKTKFPIAIMAYTKTAPTTVFTIPLAVYSPEVQTIKWANENNTECRFMDLPSGTFLAFQKASEERLLKTEIESEDFENNGDNENQTLTTESVYEKLEIATGEEHDSFWERNFEQLAGTGKYQEAVNLFGRELRKLEENTDFENARNSVREAFMKRQICDALASGKKKIFCVCGSFHVAGLETNEPMSDEELKLLPKIESSTTLMPYSYSRLSSFFGYGAGNKAPSYYQLLWDSFKNHKLSEFTERYIVNVANEHRASGNIVSSADVIEATRLAKTLANFRGSKYPTLDDLHDAVITAMGHGDFKKFINAFVKVEIKSEIGKLPDGVSRTSIQDDFYRELKDLNLEKYKKETVETIELDLRENLRVKDKSKAFMDLKRSFFFNRLNVLEIKFATENAANQTFGNWKEIWNLQWTPETEIQVVDASLLGESIENATSYKLKEKADKADSIDEVSELFNQAFYCGLLECASYILKILENISIDEAAIYEISKTASKLSNIIRFGDLRKFNSKNLIPLLSKLFLRFCLTLESSCVCNGDEVNRVIESMEIMNRIQLNHDFLSNAKNDFVKLLERISNRDDLNPKCSGFAMSLLLERGEVDEQLLSAELSRRLSPGLPADLGASWFEGISVKNHYSLIARLSLWRQLADYIQNLNDDEFKRAVVFLRRAFADFSQNEKVEIAENLAEIWGFNEDQASQVLTSKLSNEETAEANNIDLGDFNFDDI